METIRYDYKPKVWSFALAGLFFAGCAVVLGQSARHNHDGMVINGILRLDAGDATTFLWVLAGLGSAFVAAAIFGIWRASAAPQEVLLDRRGLTAPRGIGGTIVTLPYTSITDLRITEVSSQKILTIHHIDGKVALVRSMFPGKAEFDEMVTLLDARCRAVRGARPSRGGFA